MKLSSAATQSWLREDDPQKLEELWQIADDTRRANVGEEVHLRGLIEFSNCCSRQCTYCGLNATNKAIKRYRMSIDEIVEAVHSAERFGYGTVVLQSGEDRSMTTAWVTEMITRIRQESDIAITLSVGERTPEELQTWRDCGADRYLLRFETSDADLFDKIHPPLHGESKVDRIVLLKKLREIGYEVGSGVMIGIPGQSFETLTQDLERFAQLDLDMIGVGPFIPNPYTSLGAEVQSTTDKVDSGALNQVPNTELMTYKVMALARILCPCANIPSTTALATLNKASGRELGLERGANVVMPNITPPEYRLYYEIYPSKACLTETAEQCFGCMHGRIASIGRVPGTGRGDSPNILMRTKR